MCGVGEWEDLRLAHGCYAGELSSNFGMESDIHTTLPEIVKYISSIRDLLNCVQVCKSWEKVIYGCNSVWKHVLLSILTDCQGNARKEPDVKVVKDICMDWAKATKEILSNTFTACEFYCDMNICIFII
eukprot:Phypoly_transcript_13854.p1 GENE.Phypoly_transcript_13854~~Phypoly_transcript_13854.p1  ORF type:complete len:129 (+),score=10.46 Phypoly_transcript_13854:442-828(+)